MSERLNKNSGIPLYLQLKDILREGILGGKYSSGQLLPSETQLTAVYGITRQTARRAIAELVRDGLVRTEHGRGSFVSMNEIHYSIWNFNGFTDYIHSLGKIPTTRLVEHSVQEDYLKLVRARGVEEPKGTRFLTLDTSYIPRKIFPGIEDYDFSGISLYMTMREDYHLYPKRIEMRVNSVFPESIHANLFQLTDTVPLVKVEGEVFSTTGEMVEKVEVVYSPRLEFRVITTING
jgi:DNA-binding GntR family transcriptional regulator